MSRPACVLFAGGGTGGHLFPAIAVAQTLRARYPSWNLPFVGTARGVEVRHVPRYGFALHLLAIEALRGRSVWQRVRAGARLPLAMAHALALVRRLRPDVAVSVGGYAAGPAVLAAYALGVPCVVIEPNAHAGWTNRGLALVAKHVLLAFPNKQLDAHPRARWVGNPVREDLLAMAQRPAAPWPARFDAQRPLRLFAFGGSQGARAINEALLAWAPTLAARRLPVELWHQTGGPAFEEVARRWQHSGWSNVRAMPFVDNMAEAYAWADLLLCRAGAGTLAEAAVMGRASWLVPYPHAADDHQTANAQWMQNAGAARLLPESGLTPAQLTAALDEVLAEPAVLARMGRNAGALAKPRAAADIAECIVEQALTHVS